jgi:hypothetical protein
MIDSTSSPKSGGASPLTVAQSCDNAQAWVKPTLDRLSLKQALHGTLGTSMDTTNCATAS